MNNINNNFNLLRESNNYRGYNRLNNEDDTTYKNNNVIRSEESFKFDNTIIFASLLSIFILILISTLIIIYK